MPKPLLNRSFLLVTMAFLVTSALSLAACGKHPIQSPYVHKEALDEDKASQDELAEDLAEVQKELQPYLSGGTQVFFDDFNRQELGETWHLERNEEEAKAATWLIKDGWLHNNDAKNQGLWADILPKKGNFRIEFLAASAKDKKGIFRGDLKCEVLASAPLHEKGYSLINGGWNNRFDTIAKLGEHSDDKARTAALPVEENKVHRYAVLIIGEDLHFLRDEALLYSYKDKALLRGTWFGFNNWLTEARFDDLAVYTLP